MHIENDIILEMAKQKQNHVSKIDHIILIAGFITTTLLGVFVAHGFLQAHLDLLLLEFVVYATALYVYIRAFYASEVNLLVWLGRIISCVSVGMVVLVAIFLIHFVATLRW